MSPIIVCFIVVVATAVTFDMIATVTEVMLDTLTIPFFKGKES